jgi:hypothetical protein
MDCGDASMLNAKRFLNHLDYWSEAVGRTRCVGNDLLIDKLFVVASKHDIQSTFFFYRGGHDDLLHA